MNFSPEDWQEDGCPHLCYRVADHSQSLRIASFRYSKRNSGLVHSKNTQGSFPVSAAREWMPTDEVDFGILF